MRLIISRGILILLLSLLYSATAVAQELLINGVVKDVNGETIIGASVVQQGTTNIAITDIDGKFSMKVPSNATLKVTYFGYREVLVPVNGGTQFSIVMEEDSELLDEVVVIGYGNVKKDDMTGAITAIKAEDINRGAITSADQMLVGKVSGLRITPASGQPGSSGTIRIRGAASLNANNDPLIVIDGVPITRDGGAGMGNALSSVNPNDIESYTVLKDASATAIYGARASNGVIIITTKKGWGDGIKISYNSTYAIKQNSSTLDVMSGDTFRQFMTTQYPDNPTIHGLLGTANTDWQSEIYRLGFNTDQAISAYGGGKFPFRVSLGYNLDQATLKTGDNQRGNVDVSLSPKFLDDHLSVNVNVKGIYQRTNWANQGAIGNALTFDPTQPVYFTDENGNIDKSVVSNGYWNWMYADGSANTQSSVNPLSVMYDYNNISQTLRSIGNLQLNYKLHGFEDLSANVSLGYDVASTTGENFNTLGTISAMRSSNDLYNEYENYNMNQILEAYLNYNKDFGKSNLDLMGGYSWQHNYVSNDNTTWYNKEPQGLDEDLYQVSPTNAKEYYLLSFFGRANYSYDSRFLFTATVRSDASSRFSPENRWGIFPSAAFAWNLANEDWMPSKKISTMKLRLGWGRTGQQDIGDDYYPYLARYIQSSSLTMEYLMNSIYGTTLAPLAYNPNLKWETTETYNIGVDFGFNNDRVSGSLEAYYRHTFDLLNVIPTPLGSNFGNSIISNIGNMVNKGVELSLEVIPVQTKDFHWSIGGNFTLQDTEITKLTAKASEDYLGVTTGQGMGGTGGYTSLHREGHAPNTYYLYQQLYDSEGNPVLNGLVDRNEDGIITEDDRYLTGASPTPWGFFGFNTQVKWKNWDFGINAHGSLGNEIINKVAMESSSSYSDSYNKGYLNNLQTGYLIPDWTAPMENNQKYSDMYIEDGSFLRIDDINLGYTFTLKNDIKLRLAGSVQNAFLFTKYSGLDPEILSADGVDYNIIPRPRLYTLRLNINF